MRPDVAPTWSNMHSRKNYDWMANVLKAMIMHNAKIIGEMPDDGKTAVVVRVSDLLDALSAAYKADNSRFVPKLFVDACLK